MKCNYKELSENALNIGREYLEYSDTNWPHLFHFFIGKEEYIEIFCMTVPAFNVIQPRTGKYLAREIIQKNKEQYY